MADPVGVFEALERRAAGILSRLRTYEPNTASVRCSFGGREGRNIREWVTNVHWALGELSPEKIPVRIAPAMTRAMATGEIVLRLRLTSPQQDASFYRIAGAATRMLVDAGKAGISAEEAELIYLLSLDHFIRLVNTRQIPDDYADLAAA